MVYLTARLAARPLEAVAREITRRSPDRLDPVPHRLPKDEFGRMVEAVNALLQALKEAKERERAFLAEASHELRTPSPSSWATWTAWGGTPWTRGPPHRPGHRRADAPPGGGPAGPGPGEVERNLNLHIVDLGEVAREAALEYGVAAEAESAEVLGDPDRLLQLLRNLVANAVRAAGKEGVRVRVRREADHALLEVEDSGPGIPEDLLPRLFQRFARGPGGGTGLGLAIAHAIAKAHGGEIAVESRPGRTVFRVRLPLLEEEA